MATPGAAMSGLVKTPLISPCQATGPRLLKLATLPALSTAPTPIASGILAGLPVVGPAFAQVDALYPGLEAMRRRHEALRRVFGIMVEDVIAVSRQRLAAAGATSADGIRALGAPVIRFSEPLFADLRAIKAFLFARMYRAPTVMEERARATAMLNGLFPLLLAEPRHLPEDWRAEADAAPDDTARARIVLDYVAGMTDRFAISEHERLLG